VLALVYDGALKLDDRHPIPLARTDEALIHVSLAGICSTDLEITRGYAGFHGILGHEFVGVVEQAADQGLVGRRVVGEINLACGSCRFCRGGLPTHCAERTVLGIRGHDGAFAEYLTLPSRNLHRVPDSVSDEQAVFTEPLAAALQVLEQVHIRPSDRVIVLGDGRLGLLVAQVTRLLGCDLLLIGKHADKMARLAALRIRTQVAGAGIPDYLADVVIECTGHLEGLVLAKSLVRPRGVVVLKSTFHGEAPMALSPFVVDEIAIVGSRCGPFAPALRLLATRLVDVESMISATFALGDGLTAMQRATQGRGVKILLRP
jgi:threonine dehydrogenase-like Zn-dependent dehydrogenase